MITKKEVQHIAKLARLGITEKEEKKFQKELSSILDYIDKLKKVDISKIKATSHPLSIENVTRNDESESQEKNLLSLAPEAEKGYVKVKQIFK